MSDTMGAADQFAAALQGQNVGTEPAQTDPEPTTQQQTPEPQQPSYSPYAQQFLQNVPEEHRPIVGEHLKNWDAGFTRYAQQAQQQIRQYESLGDMQTLQQAVTYWNQLVNDPHSVVELLIQNGFGPRQAQQMVQQAQGQQQQDPFADYPDPVKQKFQTVDTVQQQQQEVVRAIGLIAEKINSQERAAQEAEYDRQLDQVLGQLKSQYGNFDEMFVLTQIGAGVPPDQAVQRYQQLAQSILNERGAKAPPQVISGNSLPAIKQSLETPEERTNALVAAMQGMGFK